MGKDLGYEREKLQDFVKQQQDYDRGERIAEKDLERDRITSQEKERADRIEAQEKERELERDRIAAQEKERADRLAAQEKDREIELAKLEVQKKDREIDKEALKQIQATDPNLDSIRGRDESGNITVSRGLNRGETRFTRKKGFFV